MGCFARRVSTLPTYARTTPTSIAGVPCSMNGRTAASAAWALGSLELLHGAAGPILEVRHSATTARCWLAQPRGCKTMCERKPHAIVGDAQSAKSRQVRGRLRLVPCCAKASGVKLHGPPSATHSRWHLPIVIPHPMHHPNVAQPARKALRTATPQLCSQRS